MSALDGLVVLDFTCNLPGPYATLLLAAQGAEVLKVEPPRGDPGRTIPPLFAQLNKGKKSIVLDLRDPTDQEAVRDLVERADVLVEGFRPGVMARLGVGPEQACTWNPRLVYCSISAFGQDGPARAVPGHDLNLQALAGYTHMERDGRGVPRASVLPLADLSSALAAVASITAALVERERTGEGTVLDVAMLDALSHWTQVWDQGLDLVGGMADQGPVAHAAARGPWFRTLRRRRLYALPHYGLYRCLDGRWMAVGIVDEGRFWRAFCKVLGLRGVGRLPMAARGVLGPVLDKVVAARLRTRSRRHWLEVLARADVPVTPVLSPDEAATDPRVAPRLRSPLPGAVLPTGEAPERGAHTAEVLGR